MHPHDWWQDFSRKRTIGYWRIPFVPGLAPGTLRATWREGDPDDVPTIAIEMPPWVVVKEAPRG